jgi:hypothetical protein
MRAGSPACRRLDDRRGVLDLRMNGRAKPLSLSIGSPDRQSEYHPHRCQNRRKSRHGTHVLFKIEETTFIDNIGTLILSRPAWPMPHSVCRKSLL